jgi:hypothetical protein
MNADARPAASFELNKEVFKKELLQLGILSTFSRRTGNKPVISSVTTDTSHRANKQ